MLHCFMVNISERYFSPIFPTFGAIGNHVQLQLGRPFIWAIHAIWMGWSVHVSRPIWMNWPVWVGHMCWPIWLGRPDWASVLNRSNLEKENIFSCDYIKHRKLNAENNWFFFRKIPLTNIFHKQTSFQQTCVKSLIDF